MTWREQLGRITTIDGRKVIGASFRAINFFIEDEGRSGGRRGPTHEFVKKDKPFKEDLGRKARGFSVTAYVIGDEYLSQMRSLIEALEDVEGPGDFRSAYHGKHKVICDDFTVTNKKTDGGIARFSITFGETSAKSPLPSEVVNAVADVQKKTKQAAAIVRQHAADIEDLGGLSDDFLDGPEELIREAGRVIDAPFSALVETAEDLAAMRQRIDRMIENAASLVVSPVDAFDAIFDALQIAFAPPTLPSAFRDLLNSLSDIDLVAPSQSPYQTPRRDKESELFELIKAQTKQVILFRVAELATEADFDVFGDAVTVRDELIEKLDEELDTALTDDIFQAIRDLEISVLTAVPPPGNQLQQQVQFTPIITTNSLVLAHKLYGNVEKSQEIVDRNFVKHPGFIIGGNALEVVTDDTFTSG